jgi:hypothetical protein
MMKSTLKRMLCRILIVATAMLPFQMGQASMIGTDQAVAAATAQSDRALVSSFLTRAQTASELQSLGIDAKAAGERVAAMTDEEVRTLAGKIRSMPAGADGTTVAVVLIVAAFLIWWFAMRK